MFDIVIFSEPLTKKELISISEQRFGDMVKGVIDIELGIVALGGELHADEEAELLERGSEQQNLWGINIYHALPREEWIEFDSMINIRPGQNNRSMSVEDRNIQKRIIEIVNNMIKDE